MVTDSPEPDRWGLTEIGPWAFAFTLAVILFSIGLLFYQLNELEERIPPASVERMLNQLEIERACRKDPPEVPVLHDGTPGHCP